MSKSTLADVVSSNLRECRARANLTQAALAKRCGCSDAYISQLESGARRPPLAMVGKLAAALGVTVARLLRTKNL